MTVNEESLGFELLVEQKKEKYITGKMRWAFSHNKLFTQENRQMNLQSHSFVGYNPALHEDNAQRSSNGIHFHLCYHRELKDRTFYGNFWMLRWERVSFQYEYEKEKFQNMKINNKAAVWLSKNLKSSAGSC